MKKRAESLLLLLWPKISAIYAHFGLSVAMFDVAGGNQVQEAHSQIPTMVVTAPATKSGAVGNSVPGGHVHITAHTRSSLSVPGAHIWILALLLSAGIVHAQQGGQTSSTPPLTGSVAPAGNCGVGSLYVNTTTGDLYDCNAGAWNKVNGGGSGAFSSGLGSSFQDATEIAAPANPSAGNDRLWLDSTTHLLACHTSGGANCMPAGGAGTVTQVTSGNFSPLFNVSVATNTTTPAFSFSGISQSQNLFFASPNGSSGVGAYRSIAAPDLPASANSCATHQFTISLASGFNVTCAQPVAADIGSIPGSSGQLLFNNAGAIGAEDPVISYSTPAESTAAWTSATGGNSAVSVNLYSSGSSSSLSTVGVTLNQGSTITGGAVTFEVSDTTAFTNAYNASCWQATTGSIVSTYTLVASTNQAFVCNVASYQAFRVRLSTTITGSATVNVGVQPSAGPTQPYVVVSNTPNVNIQSNASVNVNQVAGAATGATNPLYTAIADGTNGPAAVKAPSTAAVAADKAVVVALSPNNTPNVNIQSNASINEAQIGGTAVVADPCQANAKTRFVVNLTASGQIITGTSAKKTYICDMMVITATAQNIALVEGTGTTCATGTAGMSGGTTAGTGWNFAANQGYTFGGGDAEVFSADSAAADNVCLLLSGTGQTSGSGHYVQQ